MITEAELSYEDMKQAEAKGYLCAKCQGRLIVAWGGAFGVDGWVLRCHNSIEHTGMTRHDRGYEKLKKEYFSMDSTALTTMDKTTMLARINQVKFPQDLSLAEKNLLSEAAITYGFDPIMSEISIFQGKPYISIDGRYRKAQESGLLDGVESRPATKQEREDWSIPVGDFFFRADVYVKGASRPFVGWGRVFEPETRPGSRNDPNSKYKPTQSNPQRMAEKRAEAQALRKAFHIPLPSIEDIGLENENEYAATVVVEEPEKPKALKAAKPEPAKAPAPAQDKRGQFEKEGRDVTEEVLAKASAETPPAEATEQVLHPEEAEVEVTPPETPEKYPIDLDWLKEQMDILVAKGIAGWNNPGVAGKIQAITGKECKTVREAVKSLNAEQAAIFVQKIRETVEMA